MNVPLVIRLLLFSGVCFSDKNVSAYLIMQHYVFVDGLQQYCLFATEGQTFAEFYEDEQWILSDEREWPFAFVTLCETFGIDVDSMRAMLMRKKGKYRNDTSDVH